MQSSAMLSSGGPVHGINSNQPPLSTSQMALLNQLQDRAQGQSLEQLEHQGQAGMDEMLEQIFAMQPWVEAGGLARANWDYSAAQTSGVGIESMLSLQGGAKQFNVPSMSQEILENAQALASGQFRDREEGTGVDSATVTEGSCYSADGSTLLRQNGTPLHDNRKSCPLPSETVSPDKSGQLQLNPKTMPQNSVTETSASSRGRQSPPPIVTPWHQPYADNAASSLPLNLVPSLRTDATPTEAQLLGKRIRNEEAVPNSVQDGLQGNLFNTLAGLQTQIGKLTDQHIQPSQGTKSTQGVSSQAYGGQASVSQQSTGTNSNPAGGSRPRVRARRGQATDPHSIAERLRRERIAERMKALQELVPNSNKTDKASMLDEIIDYVKFLQLQVKVLSMSRLGSAGAVSSMVADLPAEEGISLTEKQVARLMEEDMGTAMQYLQSKGLCLMPIHLASSISSNNVKPQTANQSTEKNESQSTIVMPNNGSLGPAAISGPFTSERNGSENTKLTNMLSRTAKDSEEGKPALSGSKATDETQKRLQ